jgi:hypothetical protein
MADNQLELFYQSKTQWITLSPNLNTPHSIDRHQIRILPDVAEVVDGTTLNTFKRIGLEVREVQLFMSPPNFVGAIHIDGHCYSSQNSCINYIDPINRHWAMQWFNCNGADALVGQYNQRGRRYLAPNIEDCTESMSCNFDTPTLLKVGVPHRVVNLSSNLSRFCFSFRFYVSDYDTIREAMIEHGL